MKIRHYIIQILFSLLVGSVHGQGFIYDQQSTNITEGSAGISGGQPIGESFTPSLSSVGFVTLFLFDFENLNSGATVFINLRSSSITGPVLGSSMPVFMPFGFNGISNFSFSTPVTVQPGTTYYLQPFIQSGDEMGWVATGGYAGGSEFDQGVALTGKNLWFQEGVVAAPEPSPSWLILVGTGILFYARRSNVRRRK